MIFELFNDGLGINGNIPFLQSLTPLHYFTVTQFGFSHCNVRLFLKILKNNQHIIVALVPNSDFPLKTKFAFFIKKFIIL